jgi:mRNA interferase MazF
MTPKAGEVYMVDLGMVAKVRPMVVVSRDDPSPPRALVLCVPFTTQNRGSAYEVAIGKLRFLREESWANVQGLVAVGKEKLERRIGQLSTEQLTQVKTALRFALDL